ncbi:hypothetical protein MSAN_00682200 [Mycena sanguinolenta]|uniref:Zn(2)-C6 fungal-type domain-containing protein n=1 Tax=Mycena sanguinolenta TaxID=230812 RepID=A0A8H6Z4P5_9AGAR|nr:hypothetical protein MSAN_00682200 [Mycena sanguinolenta]
MDPPPPPQLVPGPIPIEVDSTWPKRTAKACSSCRRDKTRCDGARPCGGCTKKKLQCTDGCDPCRRARARCEKTGNGTSCKRCDLKELVCTEESPPAQIAPSPSAAGPASPDRVKSACQNCKTDNKKCDNQRPCSRCVARYETCVPLPRVSKQTRTRCEGCKQRNVRCEDARPCQNCVAAGTECVNLVARKTSSTGTRVRAACVNCRRNKVRCDGERPCSGCSRRGLECQEQVCKRCAEGGVEECTHRARLNDTSPGDEPIASTSTAVPQPSTSAMPAQHDQFSEPSMFAPLSVPFFPPAHSLPSSNTLPVAASSADPARA